MSQLIDEKTKLELQRILANLLSPVRLLFFTQQNACPTCSHQLKLLEELASLTDKLELKVYDFVLNGDEAINYKIDKIPRARNKFRRFHPQSSLHILDNRTRVN